MKQDRFTRHLGTLDMADVPTRYQDALAIVIHADGPRFSFIWLMHLQDVRVHMIWLIHLQGTMSTCLQIPNTISIYGGWGGIKLSPPPLLFKSKNNSVPIFWREEVILCLHVHLYLLFKFHYQHEQMLLGVIMEICFKTWQDLVFSKFVSM